MADKGSALLPGPAAVLSALVLLMLALGVLVQANPGTHLPSRDYGFYVYIGDQINHGKLPYRDAWESKPPAIFYLNALALRIGRGSRWGIWLVEFASLAAALALSFLTLRRLWGIWPALGGTLLWAAGLRVTLQGGNMTEEYPLALHFLSIALFLSLAAGRPRRLLYSFLLGAAFGVSFLFRPNNAVVEAAVILALLIVQLLRRDLRSMLIQLLFVALGALVPLGITLVYFWSQGLLAPLLEASFLYNLTYSSTSIGAGPPLITGFRLFGAAAWIGLAGYGLAIYRLSRRDPLHPLYLLLLVGWPLVIFTSDPARRGYAHYFMNWLPFLALLAGLVTHFLVSRLPAAIRESRLWQSASLGILFVLCLGAFVFGGPAADYRKALERFPRRASIGLDVRTRTAAYVENHTEPGQLVLFWAATPGENFMSRRESPSAYLFYPLYVPSPISARMNQQFLQDVITKRPVLIVDIGDHEALSLDPVERTQQIEAGYAWEYPPNSLDEFFQYVEGHYYLEARVGDRAVYRLRPR